MLYYAIQYEINMHNAVQIQLETEWSFISKDVVLRCRLQLGRTVSDLRVIFRACRRSGGGEGYTTYIYVLLSLFLLISATKFSSKKTWKESKKYKVNIILKLLILRFIKDNVYFIKILQLLCGLRWSLSFMVEIRLKMWRQLRCTIENMFRTLI